MRVGEPFRAELLYPVYADNQILLPAKTIFIGTVTELQSDHSRRIQARINGDFTPFHPLVILGWAPGNEHENYSHSIVPGGFEVMSYTTRLIPRTSLTILLEIVRSTSYGSGAQSAVIPSSVSTARIAHV